MAFILHLASYILSAIQSVTLTKMQIRICYIMFSILNQ